MNVISIISEPTKLIYYEIDRLFSDRYNILYLTKIIRDNQYNDDDLWISIMEDIFSGNLIKNQDISNVIYDHISKSDKDCILLTAFPRTSEQINYLKGFLGNKEFNFELIGVFNTSKDDPSLRDLFIDYDRVIEIAKISELKDKLDNGSN